MIRALPARLPSARPPSPELSSSPTCCSRAWRSRCFRCCPQWSSRGEAATGILFSSYAAAMIVATLFTGRVVDRRGPKGPLLTELIVLVAATLLFATGGPYWLLLVACFVQGIAGGIAWVAALSLIAAATGIEKRGQMMGIAMSTVTLGVLAGPPLGGFLVDAFGPASPFLIAAAVAIVDIALLLA